MPKIDIAKMPVETATTYPDPFWQATVGREKKRLGNAVGLNQFGVNLVTLKPGAWSSQRHWHRNEDEFVYVLEGEITLCEDHGEIVLKPGDAAGWKADSRIGHCLINRTRAGRRLHRGRHPRARIETAVYPDIDMRLERDKTGAALSAQDRRALSAAEGVSRCRRSTARKSPSATTASYPKEFAAVIAGREKQKLGDAVGLTQFGVNIARIKANSKSALRHWHESEDEFIYMLEGELVLHENDGETVLKPGDAAGWRANGGIGHCLINRTDKDALYLEVGTRSKAERVHYPDVDFRMERDDTGRRWMRKYGEPIKE